MLFLRCPFPLIHLYLYFYFIYSRVTIEFSRDPWSSWRYVSSVVMCVECVNYVVRGTVFLIQTLLISLFALLCYLSSVHRI